MAILTILMPAYNAERFIREAIDSLLNQSFTDFELWVINDASTDTTRQIASSYTDLRLKVFSIEINKGRDVLVNEWVQKITTPFFTITDADDASHPLRLQKQLEILEADTTLMMCGTSYVAMDENGFLIRNVTLPSDRRIMHQNLHRHAQLHGPTTVMRNEVLEVFKPLYRSGYFEADADLCCRMMDKHKATNCEEFLYYYRVVAGSMSRQNLTPVFLNSYKIIFWLYEQRKNLGADVLQTGEIGKLADFIQSIEQTYTPGSLQRQIAFYHLYWGLTSLAAKHAFLAVLTSPFRIKNYFALSYIILRIGLFSLNRAVKKRHYKTGLNTPS